MTRNKDTFNTEAKKTEKRILLILNNFFLTLYFPVISVAFLFGILSGKAYFVGNNMKDENSVCL